MQESESPMPSDDVVTEDVREADETPVEPSSEVQDDGDLYEYRPAPDPVVRWLIWAIAGIVILWLAGIVSAMFFGMLTPTKSPRTSTERDLTLLSAQVSSGKANTLTWARYIDALSTAGEYSKARDMVNTALAQAKSDKSFILAEEARLDLLSKDYGNAAKVGADAMAQADSEWNAVKESNAAKQITMGTPRPDSWNLAALTRAQALEQSGDKAGALKAYDVYLAQNTSASDILVTRGDLKASMGDKAGAAADYKKALSFIPDFKPALDGLNKIGVAK